MVLIYAEKITPRLNYITRLLLGDLMGLEVRYTTNEEEYLQAKLPKINYSKNPIQSGIYIQAVNLLFETDIFQQEFQVADYQDTRIFFLTGKKAALPFDPFAASFYLVSRYEEYLPHIADGHGRFPARESLMFKENILNVPVVNEYARILGGILCEYNPGLKITEPQYSYVNTVDIDAASSYMGKGLIRSMGAYAKDVANLRFSELVERTKCFAGMIKDPYETFDYQLTLQEKYGFRSIYFVLFARLSQFDRSLTMHSNRLHKYIKGISDFCEVGIHPSYRSNSDVSILDEELRRLEEVLNRDVTKSRQHFLKLSLPDTYRHLMELEITDDYTMGFASEPGYRAGICTPFHFYDLELERETNLRVHPFSVMDGTFIYYQEVKPEDAWNSIAHHIEVNRRYGGQYISIWHNRIFSEKEPEWKGWNAVYEEMVKLAT